MKNYIYNFRFQPSGAVFKSTSNSKENKSENTKNNVSLQVDNECLSSSQQSSLLTPPENEKNFKLNNSMSENVYSLFSSKKTSNPTNVLSSLLSSSSSSSSSSLSSSSSSSSVSLSPPSYSLTQFTSETANKNNQALSPVNQLIDIKQQQTREANNIPLSLSLAISAQISPNRNSITPPQSGKNSQIAVKSF